jgi:hypothetical protein
LWTDVIGWSVNEKPSPTNVDTVFNGLHSIQKKQQTGFIQTNLKVFKDQRVIFSTGKYKHDGLHMLCYNRTTQQKPVLIILSHISAIYAVHLDFRIM